jgi:hypothetical protein
VLPLTIEYFHRNRGERWGFQYTCRECKPNLLRKAYKANPQKRRQNERRRYETLRRVVLSHYSHGEPRCACCGESIVEFLCIDHINGCTGIPRRAPQRSSWGLYRWLRRNGYPEGFRVLCHNCNSAFARYGFCPHHPPPAST